MSPDSVASGCTGPGHGVADAALGGYSGRVRRATDRVRRGAGGPVRSGSGANRPVTVSTPRARPCTGHGASDPRERICAIATRQPWLDLVSDRLFELGLEAALLGSVEAFRARERLSARAFGAAALGNPDFIESLLRRGTELRLDTLDAVLAFMGEAPLGPLFACEVGAYLGITGTGAHRLGLGAVDDVSFVRRLRVGEAPLLREVDRVRRWMGMHSSAAQRRAIAAATLYPHWWRADPADRPRDMAPCCVGEPPRYVDPRQATWMVGLSPRTLEYYRTTGEGPAFFKLGRRVRYSVAEIEQRVLARNARQPSRVTLEPYHGSRSRRMRQRG